MLFCEGNNVVLDINSRTIQQYVATKCNRSQVQRFRGSRFHYYPWPALRMRIYRKRVIFGRSDPEFGAKLAITWKNKQLQGGLRVFNAFFVLNPERLNPELVNGYNKIRFNLFNLQYQQVTTLKGLMSLSYVKSA